MKLMSKKWLKISVFLLFCFARFPFCRCFRRKSGYIFRDGKRRCDVCAFHCRQFQWITRKLCSQSVSANDQSSFGQAQMNLQKTLCGGHVSLTAPATSTSSSNFFNPGNFFSFSIPGALLPTAVPNVADNSLFVYASSSDNFTTSSNTNINIATDTATNTPAPVSVPVSTTSPASNLPGGLSGSTDQNGVSLNPSEIMYWTNIERSNNGGLSALLENNILDKIAKIRVEDMFAKQYFDHYSPTGDNVSLEANANGYQYITIGENIAEGNFGSSRDLVTAWMNSPGHRANILNTKYTEIGVAAEEGTYQGSQVWISSQVFGEPLGNCPSPDVSAKQEIANDQTQATDLMTEITSAKAQLTADSGNSSTYNSEASVYNNLATQYNALVATMKTLTAQYNREVAAFNACIK